ncbi:tetratricopeptide repeat protein [Paraburkholderia humisilvae]|uniref:Beta-barrel assembly-enhancing protease n=1 Tax=Paraburkholderia humisilvae TaxID=627669 RepID=A0A6J5E3M9_9BURK|nr:tetratricopeptide repeat protein [Paraburkholderia humisilvae]CAB3759876.1 Beta-barrel assembly-enhancing protease [Paraburkholderia humisilvae]
MTPSSDSPRNDAHHFQAAVLLFSHRRFADALSVLQPILQQSEASPTRASALNLAGVCALNLGQLNDAEQYWRRALEDKPDYAEPHCNLGSLFRRLERVPEAEASFRAALAHRADYVDAHYNLGLLLHRAGRLPEAEAAYRDAIALSPKLATAHNNLGALLHAQGRHDEAQAAYVEALAGNPEYGEAYVNLGKLLIDRDRLQEAEVIIRAALVAQPELVPAHHHLGSLLNLLKRFDEAEVSLRHALTLAPHTPEIHTSLASTLIESDRYLDAEAACRTALAFRDDDPNALHTLGIALNRQGRTGEAEAAYRRALDIQPDHAAARFGLAALLLQAQRYEEGWPLYEARHERGDAQKRASAPDVSCPRWRGEPLHGKSLLIWLEQGFGDALQFGRYIASLKAQGVAHLAFACPPALSRLFASVDGVDAVLDTHAAVAQGQYDYWTFLLSVPGLLHDKTIPPARFITLDAGLVDHWRSRLDGLAGCKIGLVWKGNAKHVNDHKRSLPSLETLAPLWGRADTRFVSLQKGAAEDEVNFAPADRPILPLGAEMTDFADAAAVVAQLDLVISVDTAVAHLAGALGKPCWVMLPATDNEWRWTRAPTGPASPWYADNMRAFRQTQPGNWAQVVDAMRAALEAR